MTRLWVRNLIGMAVAAAALGTTCAVDLYPQWSQYRQTVVPRHVIARGGSAPVFEQTWRLGSVRKSAKLPDMPYGPSVAPGVTLVAVTIERSGAPTTHRCVGVLTDGRRRWQDQSTSGVIYPLGPGVTQFCSQPGPLQFNFLLPDNVTPTAIDITDGSAIAVRIQL